MKICDLEKCTGCGACIEICPNKCITLEESDAFGTMRPKITENSCVNCGLCRKVCHVNNEEVKEGQLLVQCYAARCADKKMRSNAASGGIASLMYKHSVEHDIFTMGTYFDCKKGVGYREVTDMKDIEWARDSKYVYSNMEKVYELYRRNIVHGKKCIFIGLPCQVAALKKYLMIKKVDQSSILYVEIVCHGVPNFKILREHLDYIEKKKKKKIDNVHFREPESAFNFTCYSTGRKIWIRTMHGNDTFFRGFSIGLFFRENCYNCCYAKRQRYSDITIGDYSGLGTLEPFSGDKYQMSLVLCNNDKGQNWFDELCEAQEVERYKRPLNEAINADGNPQLRYPSRKPEQKKIFDDRYVATRDFEFSANCAMKKLFFEYYIKWPKNMMKEVLKKIIPYRVKRVIKRMVGN